MQQIATPKPPTDLIPILPGTSIKVMDRIPKIIEGIADEKPIQQIADELGVDRVTIWRNLQRVDFRPLTSMLVTDTIEDIRLIEDPYKRAYIRLYMLGKIYSKKTVGELTVTTHSITEDRKTLRVALDHLDPDTVLKLNEALKKAQVIDAEYTVKEE